MATSKYLIMNGLLKTQKIKKKVEKNLLMRKIIQNN